MLALWVLDPEVANMAGLLAVIPLVLRRPAIHPGRLEPAASRRNEDTPTGLAHFLFRDSALVGQGG